MQRTSLPNFGAGPSAFAAAALFSSLEGAKPAITILPAFSYIVILAISQWFGRKKAAAEKSFGIVEQSWLGRRAAEELEKELLCGKKRLKKPPLLRKQTSEMPGRSGVT